MVILNGIDKLILSVLLVSFNTIKISCLNKKSSQESIYNNTKQNMESSGKESHCYADNPAPYCHFSSKTPYKAIYNESKYESPPENCQPKSMWFLVRHGIRYAMKPSLMLYETMSTLRDEIVYNHEVLNRGSLCKKDIENLKKWKWVNIPLFESDQLTPEGYVELIEQARRYKLRFPNILDQPFSAHKYQFRHTDHLKNRRTAIAYAEGIFGSTLLEYNRSEVCPFALENDLLVQIYPKCKKRLLNEDKMASYQHSKSEFKKGSHMKNVIKKVSERLGYLVPLNQEVIHNMYNLCRYMKSWYYSDLMPWCAFFSEKDLKVFEYMNDLAYYYNSGPGLEVNKRFGCPLLQDMIYQFKSIKDDENESHYLAKFYFGHSTTLFNLLAQLETHKQEEHITPENYDSMEDRLWKTSIIDPFGSNFVGVFLKCNSGDPYRIMFYHNEMNFNFKACGGNICSWEKFYKLYEDAVNSETCNTNYCEDSIEKDFSNRYFNASTTYIADNKLSEKIDDFTTSLNNEQVVSTLKNYNKNLVNEEEDVTIHYDTNNNEKFNFHDNRTNEIDMLEVETQIVRNIPKDYYYDKVYVNKEPDSFNEMNTNDKNIYDLYVLYLIIMIIIMFLLFLLIKNLCLRKKYIIFNL